MDQVDPQGDQSQFSPLLLAPGETITPLAKVHAHLMEHISEAFPVERLTEISGVSPRSIARMFVRELNITPHVSWKGYASISPQSARSDGPLSTRVLVR